jgi:Lhr-like helicase
MNTLTIAGAKKHIISNYGQPRHNVKSLVLACRKLAKQEKVQAKDLFHLLIENSPMNGTHSYGFHTAYGRHLIETLQSYYYQIDRGLDEDEVLILN